MMSFPKPGITLALDFPIKPDNSFPLFERLADMTLEFGGRLYPAKDAAMTAAAVPGLLPAMGAVRPLPRPHAHLQLLGARHRRKIQVYEPTPHSAPPHADSP